jgi:capsular polysaccharide biosynthesis protein
VDDSDQTVTIGQVAGGAPPAGRLWADRPAADPGAEGPAADAAAGLASLSFITAAIRRRHRLWCITAALGLLLGSALYVLHPPRYQATTEILITNGPNEDLTTAITTDAALAESRPVAAIAIAKLGLHESITSLLTSFTAVALTNRVLTITVNASSAGSAMSQANALSFAFLQFRATQLRAYEKLVSVSLNQQVATARAKVQADNRQIKALTGGVASPQQTPKLGALQTQLSRDTTTLTGIEQAARQNQEGTVVATNTAVQNSKPLSSASLVVHSRKKTAVIYAVTGLIAGLMLGIGYVAISVLLSDRLRRRDDVAHALGTSVRLSVTKVRLSRLWPGRHGLAAASLPAVQRIASHWRTTLPKDPAGTALAVIPADDTGVAALALVTLAQSCAKQDRRVILADLCPGAPAGRLLGARKPGVHEVQAGDVKLTVMIPGPGSEVAAGPLMAAARARPGAPDPDLAAAYKPTDVLLSLVHLDPMLGADHLTTWAGNAVVLVTTGRSSWTRVQAVGELIRLSGARLVSAVLVGADRGDESLGRTSRPAMSFRRTSPADHEPYTAAEDVLTAVNGIAVPAAGEGE